MLRCVPDGRAPRAFLDRDRQVLARWNAQLHGVVCRPARCGNLQQADIVDRMRRRIEVRVGPHRGELRIADVIRIGRHVWRCARALRCRCGVGRCRGRLVARAGRAAARDFQIALIERTVSRTCTNQTFFKVTVICRNRRVLVVPALESGRGFHGRQWVRTP